MFGAQPLALWPSGLGAVPAGDNSSLYQVPMGSGGAPETHTGDCCDGCSTGAGCADLLDTQGQIPGAVVGDPHDVPPPWDTPLPDPVPGEDDSPDADPPGDPSGDSYYYWDLEEHTYGAVPVTEDLHDCNSGDFDYGHSWVNTDLARCPNKIGHILDNQSSCPPPAIDTQFQWMSCCELEDTNPQWEDSCLQCGDRLVSDEPNGNIRFDSGLYVDGLTGVAQWFASIWGLLSPLTVGPTYEEYGANDMRFVNAMFNFLQDNADICYWLVCLTEGTKNAECIEDRLLNPNNPQRIVFEDEQAVRPCGPDCTFWSNTLFGGIHIVRGDRWTEKRRDFVQSYDSGDYTEALCSVAEMSSVLLHEMLHGCLSIFNESADDEWTPEGSCGCDTTDMVENTFLWAVGQRYPCLQSCAKDFTDPGLLFSPC